MLHRPIIAYRNAIRWVMLRDGRLSKILISMRACSIVHHSIELAELSTAQLLTWRYVERAGSKSLLEGADAKLNIATSRLASAEQEVRMQARSRVTSSAYWQLLRDTKLTATQSW